MAAEIVACGACLRPCGRAMLAVRVQEIQPWLPLSETNEAHDQRLWLERHTQRSEGPNGRPQVHTMLRFLIETRDGMESLVAVTRPLTAHAMVVLDVIESQMTVDVFALAWLDPDFATLRDLNFAHLLGCFRAPRFQVALDALFDDLAKAGR